MSYRSDWGTGNAGDCFLCPVMVGQLRPLRGPDGGVGAIEGHPAGRSWYWAGWRIEAGW